MKKPWTRYEIVHCYEDYWWQEGKWKLWSDVDKTKSASNMARTHTKAAARRIASKSSAKVVMLIMRTSRKGGRTRVWELIR